jgi:DNA-binding NtrC family response regulator
VVAEFEREFAKRALEESGGNVSAAARLAGKERRAFGRLLRKHGIDRSAFG